MRTTNSSALPYHNATSSLRISVLTTIFNASQYLAEAIESVIAQTTSQSWELILVDDGSEDDSVHIARRYAAEYSGRIRLFRHAGNVNRGISASRNLALSHARGEFIAFLDADDVLLPHHLDTLAACLDRHAAAAMVYAAAERWVDFDLPCNPAHARAATWGQNFLPPLLPSGQDPGMVPPGALLEWILTDESFVPCICAVLVRRTAALAVGGFADEFLGLFDDQVFHARISSRFPIVALDECVSRYRQHPRSCCARGRIGSSTHMEASQAFRTWLEECQ